MNPAEHPAASPSPRPYFEDGFVTIYHGASPRWRWPISVMVQRDLSRVIVVWRGWRW